MKFIKNLFFFSLIILVYACSKDSIADVATLPGDGENNNGNDRVAVQAKVDGVEFKAFYSKTRAGISDDSFFVEAFTHSEEQMITLLTDDFQGVGTYPIIQTRGNSLVTLAEYAELDQPTQNNNQIWLSPWEEDVVEGEFTITHLTENNVKGTFYFSPTNDMTEEVIHITEGTFDSVLYR